MKTIKSLTLTAEISGVGFAAMTPK
ncbi:MAG: hypothetical protein QOI88_3159, partial [Gammaproteobacteria bacterium]|nr:hypothetical protein [Gammaproteobacteria bacterium]